MSGCPVYWCGMEATRGLRPCAGAGAGTCFRPSFGPDRDRCFCSLECRDRAAQKRLDFLVGGSPKEAAPNT